jgi:hypothetical protein
MLRALWVMGLGMCFCACTEPSGSSTPPDANNGVVLCGVDEECGGDQRCRGGVCAPLECTTAEQCISPQVCSNGLCVNYNPANGCAQDVECPDPYVCDGFTRRCFNPETGLFFGESTSSSAGGSSTASSAGGSSSAVASSAASGSSFRPSSAGGSSSGTPTLVNLGGWRIKEEDNSNNAVIPSNTMVPRGGLLVIGRDATQSQFESRWGRTLGPNVKYLKSGNANGGVPVVNGDEKWSIYNAGNTRQDGITFQGDQDKSYKRNRAGNESSADAWDVTPTSGATPGTTEIPAGTTGVLVSEWSDADDYKFEFIEVYVNP